MMKSLPIRTQSFVALRRNNRYYVDKTAFIKRVLVDDSADVLLITRPRRFGKTLFLDTLNTFLRIGIDGSDEVTERRKLFDGLEILQDEDFCKAYMCRYPTITLSLKSAEGASFLEAYQAFARNLVGIARSFGFLGSSTVLSAEDKETLARYKDLNFMQDLTHQDAAKSFLKTMTEILSRHYGRQVVLLIDEYDVPLAKAAKGGYYDKMLPLIRGFLGEALKPDPLTGYEKEPYLKKAVLTGCLRVGKESIFTGLNNLTINTVWSEDLRLSEAIGFTPMEVAKLLDYYGLTSRSDDVKSWYDGYKFAGKDVYCPWDVINFASEALKSGRAQTFEPRNYWANTSSNDAVQEFLGFLDRQDTEKMQTLVDGGSVEIDVNEQLSYGDMKEHRPQDFWTLLLATGYLTLVNSSPKGTSNTTYTVKIPNREILETFKTNIQSYFSNDNPAFTKGVHAFVKAVLAGNPNEVSILLKTLLRRFISVRDTATKAFAENFYQGFLNEVFACAGSLVSHYKSQPETGNGYADMAFLSETVSGRTGVVVEIKYCKDPDDLYETADAALLQIQEKHYGAYFDKLRCSRRLAYGMAFCGKDCAVSFGELRSGS